MPKSVTDIKAGGKTPEEIKKGLECRARAYNGMCQYACSSCDVYVDGRFSEIFRNAIVLIQQLESSLAQVERERDAMSYDMHQLQGALCAYCKNLYRPKDALHVTCSVFGDGYGDSADSPLICGSFKWRGVCEENTKEDSCSDTQA